MRSSACVAVDKMTGEVLCRFESITDAANRLGISWDSAYGMASCGSLGYERWTLRKADSWNGFEDVSRYHNKPVIVRDGGRIRWFPTVKDAAKALCVTDRAIWAAAKTERRILGRYRVKYQNVIGKAARAQRE